MHKSFVPLVDDSAEKRLSALMGVIMAGSDTDLVTPLIGRDSPHKWMKRKEVASDVWASCKLSLLPQWLREVELSQRELHGSYSNVFPFVQGLKEGVDRFFCKVNTKIDRHAAKVADAFVAARVRPGTLCTRELEVAADSFEGSTSYGWPFVSSDKSYFGQCLDLSKDLLEGQPKDFLGYPAILGLRGSPAGLFSRPKSRVVWQCSRVVANVEKMVFMPIFSALQHMPGFSAWTSAMEVGHAISGMFCGRRGDCNPQAWSPVMSVDFSKFDVTLSHDVIDRIYSIIRQWFRAEDHFLISNLNHYMRDLSLVTPEGIRSNKARGVPSGSVMTNLIDSLANLWVISYSAARLGSRVVQAEVQGDDGVYLFDQQIDPSELKDVVEEDLGMVINPDKGLIAENEVHYLQNVHRRSFVDRYGVNVGVRPIMRALNGMMSYERFRPGWNSYLDSIRWAMQLSSTWYHPCFTVFAEWLYGQDRNMLQAPADLTLGEYLVSKAGGPSEVLKHLGRRYEGAVSFSDDVTQCPGIMQLEQCSIL